MTYLQPHKAWAPADAANRPANRCHGGRRLRHGSGGTANITIGAAQLLDGVHVAVELFEREVDGCLQGTDSIDDRVLSFAWHAR